MIRNLALASALALAPAITDKKQTPYKQIVGNYYQLTYNLEKNNTTEVIKATLIDTPIEYQSFNQHDNTLDTNVFILKIDYTGKLNNISLNMLQGWYDETTNNNHRFLETLTIRIIDENIYTNILNEETANDKITYLESLQFDTPYYTQNETFTSAEDEYSIEDKELPLNLGQNYYMFESTTFNTITPPPNPQYVLPTIENLYISLYVTQDIPEGTTEIIDLPGLMFQILGMPFAFISQAFNLTLFAGTPYAVNVSNLIFFIIAGLIIIIIVKKIVH